MNNRRMCSGAVVFVVLVLGLVFSMPVLAAGDSSTAGDALTPHQARTEGYYHLMNAALAARRGDLRVVLRQIDAAIQVDPESSSLRAVSAELLMALGQQDLAERWARQALELDDGQRSALRILGEITYRRALSGAGSAETTEEAIGYFERLAEGPPEVVEDETLQILVNLELQREDLERAEFFLKRLADRRPGDLLVHRQLVAMRLRNGRTAEALEILLQFVERYGEVDSFVQFLPGLMEDTEDWSRLADVIRKRMDQDADSDLLANLVTESYLRAGRYRDAAALLEERRNQDPGNNQIAEQLAAAYAAGGRLAESVEFYLALTRQRPQDHDLLERLGQTLYRQRDISGAIDSWSKALDAVGTSTEGAEARDLLRWRLAMAELDRDQSEAAAARLQAFERPTGRDYQTLRLRVAIAGERFAEAEAATRALEGLVSPGRIDMYEGERALGEKRFEFAERRLDRAAKRLGPGVVTRLAEMWRDAGRLEKAEQLLRERLESAENDASALFALGRFLEREGRFEEAVLLIEKGLESEPENTEMLNYLGYSLADAGKDLPRAITLIERALVSDPWNAAYLDSLGWAYFKNGDFEAAREPLERAARDFPFDPVVLEHLGDLYFQKGDRSGAISLWNRALASLGQDESEPLKEKLKRTEKSVPKKSAVEDRDPS